MKLKQSIGFILFALSVNSFAAPTIGNADVTDFTLAGNAADGIAFSTENGQSGPDGNSGVFDGTFVGTWNLLAKVDGSGTFSDLATIPGVSLALTFDLDAGNKSGVWSVTSSKTAIVDLVLGMHAGGATTSFFFNDEHLTAGQTANGTFNIDWLNNGGNIPNYSNLTMFYDPSLVINPNVITPVPEPETYAMMLGGLGLIGFMATRRRKNFGVSRTNKLVYM